MQFSIEYIEYFILVLIRVSCVIVAAPLFRINSIPRKVKVGLSFFLAVIVTNLVDYNSLDYQDPLGYGALALQEGITGLLIGMAAGFGQYILSFSGHMVDMEIGFAMAMEMDPTTNVQSTVSANFFTQLFLLMFLVGDMHYFVIDALYDSYQLIPIGGAAFRGNLLEIFMVYMADYFMIGFRIILPVFSCILVINVVLGILAKIAPQMNMFVIGMQLKIFVGLFILFTMMFLLPQITDMIFEEMRKMTDLFMKGIMT